MSNFKFPGGRLILAGLVAMGFCTGATAQQTNSGAAKASRPSVVKLVEPADAKKLIDEKKVVIIDVRTPAEYASGHIQGSTNLNLRDPEFAAKLEKLDKSQAYLVHCAVGMRSAKACETMDKLDFATIYDMKGGLDAWHKAGLPMEK